MRLTPVRFHFFLVLAGFIRPVVLLGPIADITRDKLLQDMPEVFAIPSKHFCPFNFVAYFKILNFSNSHMSAKVPPHSSDNFVVYYFSCLWW